MKKVWHKANPEVLQKLREGLAQRFPDLQVTILGDVVFLRGSFPVIHEGEVLDLYEIEVEIPVDFPDSVPRLRETGGRIPLETDRHMDIKTGDACPIVPEEWLLHPAHGSILGFLKGPVRNFFIGQSLAEQGDPWPFGERLHGRPGLIQFYEELFETTDTATIIRYIECLRREGLKGHWECPCGSGKRLRDCHLQQLRILREKMPRRIARRALERLNLPS